MILSCNRPRTVQCKKLIPIYGNIQNGLRSFILSSCKQYSCQSIDKQRNNRGVVSEFLIPEPNSRIEEDDNVTSKKSLNVLVNSFKSLHINARAHLRRPFAPFKKYFSTHTDYSLDDVANLITTQKCKNIVVMAGAGISTPSGIPDFRSPGTGLYDNLEEYNLPDPMAVFDIYFFSYNPKPFFKLAKELYPGKYCPNKIHYFIKMLHTKGLLLRIYTQNIDALERVAGIPESALIEAHGSFATATCRKCRASYNGDEILGVIKPDIVFFGENLPQRFFTFKQDFAKCDLLIVLGTSLEVEPFASLVEEVNSSTFRFLINRDVVGPFERRQRRKNDVVFKGDIVEGIEKLATALSWEADLEDMVKDGEKLFRDVYAEKNLELVEGQRLMDSQEKILESNGIINMNKADE